MSGKASAKRRDSRKKAGAVINLTDYYMRRVIRKAGGKVDSKSVEGMRASLLMFRECHVVKKELKTEIECGMCGCVVGIDRRQQNRKYCDSCLKVRRKKPSTAQNIIGMIKCTDCGSVIFINPHQSLRLYCNDCREKRDKIGRDKSNSLYMARNKDKIRLYYLGYHVKHRDKLNKKSKDFLIKEREKLSDYYIKTLIYGTLLNKGVKLSNRDITEEMIEAKREILKVVNIKRRFNERFGNDALSV